MEPEIRYRVCEERNVAAAFEHFRRRRRPLRAAAALFTNRLPSYFLAYFMRKALISSMRS